MNATLVTDKEISSTITILIINWITFHLFLYVIGFVGITTETFNLIMCFVACNSMLVVIKVTNLYANCFEFLDSIKPYYAINEIMCALMSIIYLYFVVNLDETSIRLPVAHNNRARVL